MFFCDELVRVELPHSDPKRWNRLQALYQRLYHMNDSETLISMLQEIYQESGHTGKDLYGFLDEATGFRDAASNSKFPFSGLQIFLDDVLNESERTKFYKRTLPFIANLAFKLDEYAPKEGIKISNQQEPCSISLDRKFIASILASGFLCALPDNNSSMATRTINFVDVFANFHRSELKDVQAAKLYSVLCYFERLAWSDFDVSGKIILQRQVVDNSSLPSLTDWTNSDTKLCPMIVDHQRKKTNTDVAFLEVDFSDCFTGRNLLGNKHGKQELYFCTYPELLVTSMFMAKMEENDSLLIKGAERFSTLDISAKGVRFAGDFQDSTERDIYGNLQRTVASVSLIEDCDTQNEEELVLRLLNQALVCFNSLGTPCSLIKMTDRDEINNGYGEEIKTMDKSEPSENNDDGKDAHEIEDLEEKEDECGIAYIEDEMSGINGNLQLSTLDKFCDSLVSCALSDAKGEIGIKPRVHSEDAREVLEDLMKKSVREVFENSPEKHQKYEAKIIDSPPIPKCLQSRTFKYADNSPLVPGTPPSSPTKRSLVTSGNQSPVSGIAPPNTPSSEEVRLGTTSFADSLAESLMSCVMLSSSLATSIATIAATPLRSTSVAMETLQQSPVKKGQQILSSFLLPRPNSDEKSLGGREIGLIDLSTENDVEDKSILYVDDTSEEENEARRRSLNELAFNLFQEFASKLAHSVVKSATGLICEDVLEDIDEKQMRDNGDEEDGKKYGSGDDNDGYNYSNEDGSGYSESDEDYSPSENSNETSKNKPHDIEVNTDNKESNQESQSTDSDSDSDQDSTEKHWEGVDIDKELEDRLYELDLTDNEDMSNNDHHDSVAEMANSMANNVLSGAYPEVVRDLKEKTELYAEALQMLDKQSDSDLEAKSSLLPRFPENGISTELYFGYAKNFSKKIIKDALVDVSRNAETDSSDGKILEVSSKAENAEMEENSLLYAVEDLKEGVLDENDNVKLEEEGRGSEEDFESGEISSKELKTDRHTSISEEILDEFAHVLTEQLLETSVAIADSLIQLQGESLSMRPIASGSWSCGGPASDPELEAVIQWIAASAVGCPAVIYYASGDMRLEKFSKVQQVLRLRDWRIRDVMKSIMRYSQQDKSSQVTKSTLFQLLLEECQASYY